MLFNIKPGSLDYYIKYSQQFDIEEWQQKKHVVMNQLKQKNIDVCDIYIYEKKYKQLLNRLIKNNDIISINRYQDIFKKHCPHLIVEYYRSIIYKGLKKTNTRQYYQSMSEYLSFIYSINKKEAVKIYNELENLYPSRYAMIDELYKVFKGENKK